MFSSLKKMDEDQLPDAVIEEEFDLYEEDLSDEIEADDEQDEQAADANELEEVEEITEKDESPINLINENDSNHRINYIVSKEKRITSETIQWPEMVEAIGIRASQIENGAPVFTDVSGFTDPILMAKKEFFDRQSPLILRRSLKKTPSYCIIEHWKVRKMAFPPITREMAELTTKRSAEILNKK